MHTLGRFRGAQKSSDGLLLTFVVAIEEFPEKLKAQELVIDVKKFSERKSLRANDYFWHLCDEMAKALGSDKDTIYLLQLSKYGRYTDLYVLHEAVAELKMAYRYVDTLDEGEQYTHARCYIGSSHYTKEDMSHLIDGTVEDSKDLGIETWSEDEVNRLVEAWKPLE